MANVAVNQEAPDFEILDYQGEPIKLSNFKGSHHVLIVLNRGFV